MILRLLLVDAIDSVITAADRLYLEPRQQLSREPCEAFLDHASMALTGRRPGFDPRPEDPTYGALHPGILRVNKVLRAEGSLVLYGQRLTFTKFRVLGVFLNDIGPLNRSNLTHISILKVHAGEGKRFAFAAYSLLAVTTTKALKKITLEGVNDRKRVDVVKFANDMFHQAYAYFDHVHRMYGSCTAIMDILDVPYPDRFLRPQYSLPEDADVEQLRERLRDDLFSSLASHVTLP